MVLLRKLRVDPRQYFLKVSDHTGRDKDIFIDFRRIYVKLDDLCLFCELFRISNHTVAKTDADGKQQVAFADPVI